MTLAFADALMAPKEIKEIRVPAAWMASRALKALSALVAIRA